MKKIVITLSALLLSAAGLAPTLHAQAPSWWAGGYGMMYTGIGRVDNPETGRWTFSDNAFGAGGNLLRQFGPSLLLGVDVSYARPSYERTVGSDVVASGDAQILTAMGTGRMAYGGGSELGFYLTGGLGTIAYNLSDLDGWNSDFALRAGTGLEYRFANDRAAYLEWGRIWGYHEQEGVSGGRAQHSNLKLGLRFGL
jgi:hypothetical protein